MSKCLYLKNMFLLILKTIYLLSIKILVYALYFLLFIHLLSLSWYKAKSYPILFQLSMLLKKNENLIKDESLFIDRWLLPMLQFYYV
jgi:hypothetical protein